LLSGDPTNPTGGATAGSVGEPADASRPAIDRPGAALRTKLGRAFASGDSRLERLAIAGTSVNFVNRDEPDDSVTVLLDRNPPQVADGREPAEIRIDLTREQMGRLSIGLLEIQLVLMSGDVPFSGPVRKYLIVHSVLRGLLIDRGGRVP
jgi:hypothetical protein